jgi:hypothetical protein
MWSVRKNDTANRKLITQCVFPSLQLASMSRLVINGKYKFCIQLPHNSVSETKISSSITQLVENVNTIQNVCFFTCVSVGKNFIKIEQELTHDVPILDMQIIKWYLISGYMYILRRQGEVASFFIIKTVWSLLIPVHCVYKWNYE